MASLRDCGSRAMGTAFWERGPLDVRILPPQVAQGVLFRAWGGGGAGGLTGNATLRPATSSYSGVQSPPLRGAVRGKVA